MTNTFANTIRGENIYQSLGNAASASYDAHIANGAAVRTQHFQTGPYQPPSTGLATSVEPTNAIVASISKDVYVPNPDPEAPGRFINCGNQTTTNDYDSASRLISRTQTVSGLSQDPNCTTVYDSGPDVEQLNAYDAENHHISAATQGVSQDVQWSPTGHAYKFDGAAANVHYDGGGILFVTDPNGALLHVKVETLADINGSGQLTVFDRDFGNQYVSRHNNTFYGGISLGTTMYENKDTPPASIPYVFGGSTNDTTCRYANGVGTGCSPAGTLEYGRLEGFEYAGLTFQGVRTIDSSSGQWTTPDAYAGSVHDPMSQKAFMWDRNNPYSYSDPTGYSPQVAITADEGGGTLAWAGAAPPGDALPSDPSGLNPQIWTPDDPNPSKTGRGTGGQCSTIVRIRRGYAMTTTTSAATTGTTTTRMTKDPKHPEVSLRHKILSR
jgi:hypothetical protein